MNAKKLSAVLTAALLAGALSTTALAADRLPTGDASVTFKKAIDMTDAAGAGGVLGTMTFDVTGAQEGDLPGQPEEGAALGSTDQLASPTVTAVFARGADGSLAAESDVTVQFDMTKFTEPGVYYYRLTERDPGIAGLTAAPAYLLKARVVNADAADPNGTSFKIDYAALTPLAGGDKVDFITNSYTTYALSLTKRLAGDFADYGDSFDFTLTLEDPDAEKHMASVTVRTGEAGGALTGEGTVLSFDANGRATITETIRANQKIEVSGLPEGAFYTIAEGGDDAAKYTTDWATPTGTVEDTPTLAQRAMTAADTDITVTNTREAAAPTGLLLDAAPYGAMLALAAGSAAVSAAAGLLMLVLLTFGGFALWQDAAVRRGAFAGAELLHYKPAVLAADNPTLAELQARNPDVCGWLTIDGTNIDYPFVQGATNMDYINRDVTGAFSLSGSVFLDSRCAAGLTDPYTLMYGHHMENGAMFGDVAAFAQADFFAAHTTGSVSLPDAAYTVELFACLCTDAYDSAVYDPARYQTGVQPLLDYLAANAVQQRPCRADAQAGILALSTCAGAETNGRVVVFGWLHPIAKGDAMQ